MNTQIMNAFLIVVEGAQATKLCTINPAVVAGISVLFLIRQQEQGILSSRSAVLLQKVMARN
jgi:hypothetical protein